MAIAKMLKVCFGKAVINCTGSNDVRLLGSFFFKKHGVLVTASISDALNNGHAWFVGTSPFFTKTVFDNQLQDAQIWQDAGDVTTVLDIGV